MTLESQVASLTTATTSLLNTVNVKKSTLDASVATATTKADVATTKAGEASGSAASALAIYGNTAAMNTAVSTSTTNAATATTQAGIATTQATAAAASAASAAAIVTGVSSNRPSVRPSLLIDFAATGKLDPRITFGRSSPAMAYDGKTTVKAEENLATYSQVFTNAAWSKASVTATDNITTAPDGTVTAATIVPSASTNVFSIYQQVSVGGSQQTHSVFAKAFGYSKIQLRESASGGKYASFDLVNGVVINSINSTASITALANGWYRCAMTITYSGTTRNGIYVLSTSYTSGEIPSFTADGTSGIYLWGGQIETNPYATAYTPTTTAAITNYIPALQSYAANVARFDFNPVTGESLGLMVEEQMANLLSYSQDFDVVTYSKTNLTVAANCIIAPDGTLTADKLIATAVTGTHATVQPVSTVSGTTYALSVYAKAGEVTVLRLMAASLGALVNADLSAGTLSGGSGVGYVSSSITPVGDNWYRIVLVYTEASTGSNSQAVYLYSSGTSFTGTGYGGLYLWGMQLEAGAFATSYIPTLLTYSGRGSTATYIGDNGLIQTAAANVARYQRNIAGATQLLLETAGSNLLNWSSDLSQWGLSATSVYVIKNCAIAPDGTYTADMLAAPSTAGSYAAKQTFVSGVTSGSNFTFSIYAKAAVVSKMSIRAISDTADAGRIIDLAAGTVGANITNTDFVSCTVTPAQNGWYRVALTVVARTTTANVYIYCEDVNSAAVNGGVYFWGAQLETGSVATSYIPSTETFTGRSGSATYFDPSGVMRTAPAGLARYDFDPVTKLSKGLLIEAAATNLITYADDQANAAWTASGCTVTSNAIAAPDGTTTADKLVEDSAASTSHGTYRAGMTMTAAAYTLSIFARAAERTFIKLVFTASGDGGAYFNLGTGAVATVDAGYTATIQDVGGGYYRCSITVTCTAATWYTSVYLASADNSYAYNGNGTSGAYVWGAQLELGSVATSYIPTTSAQVTRVADSATSVANSRAADVWSSGQVTRSVETATMVGTNFSQWYRQDEGTFYSEQVVYASGDGYSRSALAVSAGSSYTNAINVLASYGGANRQRVLGYNGSTFDADIHTATVYAAGSFHKIALAFKTNDCALSSDGGAVATDTSVAPPAVDRLYIGADGSGNGVLSGSIKRIAFYPKRLTNTELQGLTS